MEKLSQKKERTEEKEYKTPFFLERKHLEILVDGMVEAIENEEFDVLVGDDASGRLPTLFLREIFLSRMKKKYPDLGDREIGEKVKTFFVAGGRSEGNKEELKRFFEKIKPLIRKKLLFITEHIFTGGSLVRMAEIMKEAGISFGVAVMSVDPNIEDRYNLPGQILIDSLKEEKLFFSGGFGENPSIYAKKELSGVAKTEVAAGEIFSKHLGAHAVPVKNSDIFRPTTEGELNKSKKDARDDVKKLAEEIEKDIFPKDNN